MKLSPATLFGAALALLLGAGGEVRADLIRWTYSWSNSPAVIPADSPGTGSIHITGSIPQTVVGDSSIVSTNLTTYSTAPLTNPDRFTAKDYTLNLTVQDNASQQSHTFTFTGQLNGTVSSSSSNLKNTFTGATTLQWQLGNNLYTVTIGPYAASGAPGASNAGSISAHASITVQTLPEPGTLALSALGAGLLGLRRYLRLRRLRREEDRG